MGAKSYPSRRPQVSNLRPGIPTDPAIYLSLFPAFKHRKESPLHFLALPDHRRALEQRLMCETTHATDGRDRSQFRPPPVLYITAICDDKPIHRECRQDRMKGLQEQIGRDQRVDPLADSRPERAAAFLVAADPSVPVCSPPYAFKRRKQADAPETRLRIRGAYVHGAVNPRRALIPSAPSCPSAQTNH